MGGSPTSRPIWTATKTDSGDSSDFGIMPDEAIMVAMRHSPSKFLGTIARMESSKVMIALDFSAGASFFSGLSDMSSFSFILLLFYTISASTQAVCPRMPVSAIRSYQCTPGTHRAI